MLILRKDNFEEEVEKSDRLVVIDFWAEWCGPCRMLAPVIDELEKDYPDVKFCKVCVDDEPELAREFNVQSIPMIALVKDNTFVDFSVGYVPKEKLAKLIEEYAS
jgi:thioredoxin 1